MAPAPDESVLGDGHVALVTGSTSGIGREVARNLAETGAAVLVHGRDRQRARETVAELPGDDHDWHVADFADVAAVRHLAERVRDEYERLDCLVNNAGTWQSERHLVALPGTDDRVELTFVVNHLAPFLLTNELRDLLVETGERRRAEAVAGDGGSEMAGASVDDPETDPDPARVVTVSSGLHSRATMDLDAVRGPDGPTGRGAYALSKLANVMFTYEFARRLPEDATATCCHPGTAPATNLARDGSLVAGFVWRLFGVLGRIAGFTDEPEAAARTPTYLARSPDVTGVTGAYFVDRERTDSSAASYDRAAQRDLWAASERWTGLG